MDFHVQQAPCWVGLDPGQARCGVAVADASASIAFPLCAIDTEPRSTLPARLQTALAGRNVLGLAVGLPLDARGQEGPSALAARELGALVAAALGVEAVYIDERFTSGQALRQHDEVQQRAAGSAKRRRQPPPHLDAQAAALILQAHLDHLGRAHPPA